MARERKVKEKTRKKIVLIIVEGITEIIALEVALNDYFEKKYGEEGKNGDDVLVFYALRQNGDEPPGGDITSAYGVNPKTIQMVIKDCPVCGKQFFTYASHNKAFCSRECYLVGRYGWK